MSTEARSKGAVSSVVYKRILAAAGPGFVVAYALLLVISNVANLGSTFWLSVWADPGRFFSNPDSYASHTASIHCSRSPLSHMWVAQADHGLLCGRVCRLDCPSRAAGVCKGGGVCLCSQACCWPPA